MKRALLVLLTLVVAGCAGNPSDSDATGGTVYRLYFLGGQSNMEGFGFSSQLAAADGGATPRVMIFTGRMTPDNAENGGIGVWAPLKPGHGTGFVTDGKTNQLSDRFGPELSFGKRLAQRLPTENIAIIKYTRGSSALAAGITGFDSWSPDDPAGKRHNQYDNALTAIREALSVRDIDGDGVRDRLVPAGIVWMQGEADAYNSPWAAADYEANLRRLMDLLRAALRTDDLPVVVGRIVDARTSSGTRMMKYADIVQAAQFEYTRQDSCAALVNITKDFGFLPDGWHYRSEDYVALGRAFADEVLALEERCAR